MIRWILLLLVLVAVAIFYPISREFHFVDSVGGIFTGKITTNVASQVLADTALGDFKWNDHVMKVEREEA